jgi:hypothetical protein
VNPFLRRITTEPRFPLPISNTSCRVLTLSRSIYHSHSHTDALCLRVSQRCVA